MVSEQIQSGLGVAAFCRERGLKSGQFFAWKKRLREPEAAQFVAVEVSPDTETKRTASGRATAGLKCVLAGAAASLLSPGSMLIICVRCS